MSSPSSTAWAIVKVEGDALDVVYHSLGNTRLQAYRAAGRVLGWPTYTTRQIRSLGCQARKVRITLEGAVDARPL